MKPVAAIVQTLSSNELAILKSVVYSSLFEYPLTSQEVAFSLPRIRLKGTEVVAIYRRSKALESVLDFQNDCFHLRDRSRHVIKRQRREAFSRDVLMRHRSLFSHTWKKGLEHGSEHPAGEPAIRLPGDGLFQLSGG